MSGSKIKVSLLVATLMAPALLWGGELQRDPLFHIERNKNANIVQYDAQLEIDGSLHAKEPVIGYWIRLANQGEIKELTWLQEKFAYGFTAKLNKKTNKVTLDMAADLGRNIRVEQHDGDYRAIADINGMQCYLEKIFIYATGSGISTKVDYIELYGSEVKTENKQQERFSP